MSSVRSLTAVFLLKMDEPGVLRERTMGKVMAELAEPHFGTPGAMVNHKFRGGKLVGVFHVKTKVGVEIPPGYALIQVKRSKLRSLRLKIGPQIQEIVRSYSTRSPADYRNSKIVKPITFNHRDVGSDHVRIRGLSVLECVAK